MKVIKRHRKYLIPATILFVILLCPFSIRLWNTYQTNQTFETYTVDLFYTDISGNLLTLHYTLAQPEDYGITSYETSLGTFEPSSLTQSFILENRIWNLEQFPSDSLNEANQLTKDILLLTYKTELHPGNQTLFYEALSPSLGFQAQLPVLLAEYTFRDEQDIQDYIKLLSSIDVYFESLINFEQYKSQDGTFMSDITADRIVAQCSDFLKNPEENYLDSVFQEKIDNFAALSSNKRQAYKKLHTQILSEHVFPAYQLLIEGLTQLIGTGKSPNGLCGFSGGKAYYDYLLKSNCGIYETVPEIQEQLTLKIQQILTVCREILVRNPDILTNSRQTTSIDSDSPEVMLEDLKSKISQDFPVSSLPSYVVKYVHKDLEEHLSPAFYLTPPIDTLSPNTIYINAHANMKGIELFTTLAHEGFPGHLYQTITFASSNPPLIRQLLSMKGYIEGWATYAETFSYSYLDTDKDLATLTNLNHILNLCIFSYLDTKIHYDGWNQSDASNYLDSFGITKPETQQEIFQVIVEEPTNYLVYCMGYLHFSDLQTKMQTELGKHFDFQDFHEAILEIGPCQFPILEEYLKKRLLS